METGDNLFSVNPHKKFTYSQHLLAVNITTPKETGWGHKKGGMGPKQSQNPESQVLNPIAPYPSAGA